VPGASARASTMIAHPLGANSGAARDPKLRYFASLGLHTSGLTCTDLPLVRAMNKLWVCLHVSRNLMDDTYVDPDDREACKALRKRGEAEVSFWTEAVDYVTFLPSTHSEFKVSLLSPLFSPLASHLSLFYLFTYVQHKRTEEIVSTVSELLETRRAKYKVCASASAGFAAHD
jgi:hypothetical protein